MEGARVDAGRRQEPAASDGGLKLEAPHLASEEVSAKLRW